MTESEVANSSTTEKSVKTLYDLKVFVLAIIYVLLVVAFVLWMYATSIPHAQPDVIANDLFSEGRAWKHLIRTQSHGMSITGTKDNDIIANYIVEVLEEIRQDCEKRRVNGEQNVPEVEISRQYPSGSLNFEFMGTIITNVYTNLTNIVARISFGEQSKANAILVNSHFDTPLDSPGAMDARTCIATMLELARAVTYKKLNHSVIFLFNGAEESLQEGSHGFITQHEWAKSVRTVLNMDAGGLGGAEVLFQTGGAAWTQAYAKSAPRPHGAVLGPDLFATGLLQSDTDYRIFRDFGNVVGIDLAFYKNGYLYHTHRDILDNLQAGSIQHLGDNALSYIEYVGTHPTLLTQNQSNDGAVFMDLLGRGMVVYTMQLQYSLSGCFIAIITIYLLMVERHRLRVIFRATAAVHLSFLAGIVIPAIVGLLIQFKKHMSWFSNWWIALALYGALAFLSATVTFKYTFINPLRNRVAYNQLEHATVWGLVLTVAHKLIWLSIAGLGTSFVYFWIGLCYFAIIIASRSSSSAPYIQWQAYPVAAFLPIWWITTFAYPVMCLFLPLTGRLGKDAPVEAVIACLVAFVSLTACSLIFPLIVRARRTRLLNAILLVIIAISLVAAFTTFPYSPMRPKRLMLQHVHRVERTSTMKLTVVDKSAALLFAGCDAGTYGDILDRLRAAIEHIPGHPPVQFEPHADTHDWHAIYPFSVFMSGYVTPAPPISTTFMRPPEFDIILDEYDEKKDERHLVLKFDYTGSEYSTLKFEAPHLLRWNLTKELPPTPRGYYVIRHIGRHGLTHWGLELFLKGRKKVDFHLTATHFTYNDYMDTLAAHFPDWTTLVTISSIIRVRSI